MAGFFGLFDYTKDGPGVPEDAPEKPRIVVYFEVLVRKFWNIAKMNILFIAFNLPALIAAFYISAMMLQNVKISDSTYDLVFKFAFATLIMCIPIITVGPVQAGFTYVMRNFAREQHAFLWSDFKEHAKKNFKQSMIVSVIDLIFTMIIAIDINMYENFNKQSTFYTVASVFVIFVFILYMMMHMYIYPMMVTFKLNIVQLFKNALIFSIIKFFPNLVILAVTIVIIASTTMISPIVAVLFYIFVNFGLISFTTNFYVFPHLKKYIIDRYEEDTNTKNSEISSTVK